MQYFIYWKSLITDYVSHGRCIFDKKSAHELVDELNKKYSGLIVHKYSSRVAYKHITNNLVEQF